MAEDSGERGEVHEDIPPDSQSHEPDTADEEDDNETETIGSDEDEEDEDEDEEEDEDEPKLKNARMTGYMTQLYRNGDATSSFLVAGDKMFIGTHNGNIHVLALPSFQSLRVYHAHSASISSISISPFPPPIPDPRSEAVNRAVSQAINESQKAASVASGSSSPAAQRAPRQQVIPNTPSNAIYIATSSIDGNVCIASLVDIKDVQLRNFARPVQAVALSPEYKNDRSYISGGTAGNLVLTVGGRSGTNATSTTTGTAAATASGWLGTIGLGGNSGKDTVLHSGEGIISTVKWSLSGKYVVWVNEQGIKIMRSNIGLESADLDSAWKRIAHIDRPQDSGWEEMAAVWKARAEWIDESSLETDDDGLGPKASSPVVTKLRQQAAKNKDPIEKLVVGWGSTIWIIHVHSGGVGVGKHAGERTVGRAEIIKILRMDCIISGLSLYTPTLLLVLAYVKPDDEDAEEAPTQKGHKSKLSNASTGSEPRGGIQRRQNAVPPELRLIELSTSEEIDTDGLIVSRFERLSAADYHLGVLPAAKRPATTQTSRTTLETLAGMGSGMWNATINATTLLSSGQSIRSVGSGDSASQTGSLGPRNKYIRPQQAAHPNIAAPGMKIFIHSPYDCILATKRDLSDHLSWLLEFHKYEDAWNLLDDHPEIISSSAEKLAEIGPGTPERHDTGDFYDDASSVKETAARLIDSSVEKEKRRIGELWIQQLITDDDWVMAGQICGKVLGSSSRWEHWVWIFAGANKFDEIANYIPTTQLKPPLPSTIYEVVLGHYIATDRLRLKELLDVWPPELFGIRTVTTALENQVKYREVREDSVEDGEMGRDWRIVKECLGKLYLADGRPKDALKCYMQLQDADTAMTLIKDYHLIDAVAEDIPGLVLIRVTKEQMKSASRKELEETTADVITLLVDEAQRGLVRPEAVITQLQDKDMPLYLFFYIRALWNGDSQDEKSAEARERMLVESRAHVEQFADVAIQAFASYDRSLLMEFLKSSTSYTFEKATQVCEERDYIPELVYLYSKTGQTKRALFLIIDRLADVSQAINFAKEQADKDLWEDLLDYSMDKPRFIRGLLEEVGTAIDPITLVRRIPEGLEIDGLRDGLSRMIKEYEIQHSISSGVARVLRGEVATAQNTLRSGQRKGVKFDVVIKAEDHIDVTPVDVAAPAAEHDNKDNDGLAAVRAQKPIRPGHCVGCHEPFTEGEQETLTVASLLIESGDMFPESSLIGQARLRFAEGSWPSFVVRPHAKCSEVGVGVVWQAATHWLLHNGTAGLFTVSTLPTLLYIQYTRASPHATLCTPRLPPSQPTRTEGTMPRIRRYRVFLVFAAIVVFTFYNFWQTGPENQSRAASFGTSQYGDGKSAQSGNRDGAKGGDPVRPVVDIQGIAHSADPLPVAAAKPTSAKPVLEGDTQVVANGVPIIDEPGTSEALVAIQTAPPTPVAITADDTVDENGQKKTIHWKKPTEDYPVAAEDLIHLPTGTPKKMPRIQFDFPAESAEARLIREDRRDKVKDEFLHAWNGYKKYAWGHDEVGPVKGGFRDPFCGWAATIVDSLDTLWIMGLKDEFEEALETVKKIDFTTSHKSSIPVFETTIRYLGGLLAAYDISGAKYLALLDKATELGEILMGVFDTPNRMPVLHYNWQPQSANERHRAAGSSNFAELGSLSMEFTRLAQLTGEHKYYDAVARITNALVEWQTRGTEIKGIFPDSVDASGCNSTYVPEEEPVAPSQNATKVFPRRPFADDMVCRPQGLTAGPARQSYSMGGGQDSTYEYFSKMWLLLGGLDSTYRTLYTDTMDAIRNRLLYRPLIPRDADGSDRDVLFSAKMKINPYVPADTNHEMIYEATHLTCFLGGMVGMGAKLFGLDADLPIAERLADGCVWAYESTRSGIMPEDARLVPCENPLDCSWDEEKYYKYLDPRWSLRAGEIEEYDVEKARKDRVRLEMAEGKAPAANINRKRAISSNSTVARIDDEPLPKIPYVPPSKTSIPGVPMNPHERRLRKSRPDPYRPYSHEEYIDNLFEQNNLPLGYAKVDSDKYILRPEAIESVFYLHRITGSPVWATKGWAMFESIIASTRTEIGHSAVTGLNRDKERRYKQDSMESFWLAETLKYFYLLYSEPDVLSLDEWVLNTEAHPFRRPS
ncbi:hypothetical protein V496_03714 [Pseudogymnoascus sp. VKM F-4515 (FW-2607)]|nr:hypothetical protein V496_03714 [Pseudogymnoascus sp. VKM F-4515 (FW-2607)]